MTEYMHLIGADSVQSAGYAMRDAASEINRGAETFGDYVRQMAMHVQDLSIAMAQHAEPPALTECDSCRFAFDRKEHAESLGRKWLLTWPRWSCRRRAPVLAVDGEGNELEPWPIISHGDGCGDGASK